MNNDHQIENLIASKLSGEASSEELKRLDEWLQASDDNRSYYDSLVKLHNAAGTVSLFQADTDRAYTKVLARIQVPGQTRNGKNKRRLDFYSFLRIAAMLAVVAGLGYAAFRFLSQDAVTTERLVAMNEARESVLADSTTVFLNRNSTVVSTFSTKKRKVELEGEAFFDLANDPERPFEVHAGGLVIHDIGTAFNVYAPLGHDSVKVMVTEGEVIVISGSSKSVTLRKGDEAVYLKSRDEFILSAIADTNALSYKTRIFVFDNATLGNLVSKVSDVYGVSIQLDGDISECRITATFRDEEPEKILEVVAETLNLKVASVESGFVLSGNKCDE